MTDYWSNLLGRESLTKEDLFFKIRDMYAALLRNLYNEPKTVPDFNIHFSAVPTTQEEGMENGYPIITVTRKSNKLKEYTVKDLSMIENFENSYTWYADDVFAVFDFREDGISPLQFITSAFCTEFFRQTEIYGIRRIRMSHMYEMMISSGVSEFFYGFYRIDINFILTLSAMTYEGDAIDCTIYVPRFDSAAGKRTARKGLDIVFSDSVPFSIENLRQIRKLVELSDKHFAIVINEAGTREIFLQTAETYCDSIYRLTLYVSPSYQVTESVTLCENELPYEWRGQLLTESGNYQQTLTTVNGCDSIFSLNLTVSPSANIMLVDTACSNELPYLWRGHQLTSAGTYFDTIPNAFGCQDIFGLQLTISHSSDTTIQDVVCAGETYTLNGFNIPTDHPSILYEQRTTVNSQGCDSIIFIMLEVLPSYTIETEAQTCENVPFEWRGHEYNTEGTYYDNLTTVSGCDSVFVLHLQINPTYDVFVTDTAIREHEYTYDGFVITPADSGTFYHEIQHYTIYGCDSITHLTLYVAYNDGVDDITLPSFSFYPNPTSAQVNIQGEQMRQVDVFSIDGKLIHSAKAESPEFTQIDVTRFPTGHYLVKITLDDGKTVTRKIIVNKR